MKKIFLSLVLFIGIFESYAQEAANDRKIRKEEKRQRINAIVRQEEEGVLTYKKQLAFGFKLTTDGYGGFLEVARAQSVRRTMLFQLDIAERKHMKEEKLQNDLSPTAPLIYGKINYFYPVKLGVQQQFNFGNKGNKNGVSLTGNFGGGFILGLLRPYQVQVQKDNGEYAFVGYNSPDSNYFLNGPFLGGPDLGTGWGNLQVMPGMYAKSSLRFDYGKYNEMINAIEIGVVAEYYTKKIPQMIYINQKQYFLSAYVSLIFGRRK